MRVVLAVHHHCQARGCHQRHPAHHYCQVRHLFRQLQEQRRHQQHRAQPQPVEDPLDHTEESTTENGSLLHRACRYGRSSSPGRNGSSSLANRPT